MKQETYLILNHQTGSITATAVGQDGRNIFSETKPFSKYTRDQLGDVFDAHEFLYAVRAAINDVVTQLNTRKKITQIGIIGACNTFLFCDKKTGAPLTPAFYMKDKRAEKIIETLKNTEHAKDYFNISKRAVSKYALLAQVVWFLKEGITQFQFNLKQAMCMPLEAYLLMNLTGLKDIKLDIVSASHFGIFDNAAKEFSPIILQDIGLDKQRVPETAPCFSQYGITKGFVPLENNIPITFMIHQSMMSWLAHPNYQYGAIDIHLSEDRLDIKVNTGVEQLDINYPSHMALISTPNICHHCIHEIIPVPQFSTTLMTVSFEDLNGILAQEGSENLWMIMNPDLNEFKEHLAIINFDQTNDAKQLTKAMLEGLFHVVKLKLSAIETEYNIKTQAIYCSSSLAIHKEVWMLLSNTIQHPLNWVDTQSLDYAHIIQSLQKEPSKKLTASLAKSIKTILPTQDPISSYARYSTWLSYYNKIFKN